jgi:glyoxylase-like metal-dependent hydrolase (beta-lactamase superfamily II)
MVSCSMSRAIDVMHLGRERVICAFETAGMIVDPGPASSVETLVDALEDEPRGLLLTHIHLDHAGAAGVLCRRFPSLIVYVHERGARHLADPSKLLESAGRLYGDRMEELWGEVAPVPSERIRALEGGERIEGGFRVEHTPGHASHHVSYFDEATGDAYVGDTAGVRLPPHEYTQAPTPPPDIDVELWLSSIGLIASWEPQALCLTHFGRFEDVPQQLERMRESLTVRSERARTLDPDEFARWSEAETRAAVDAETAASFLQAAPPWTLGLGLQRYWAKRLAHGAVS